jgi:phosphoglycolate phosphatase
LSFKNILFDLDGTITDSQEGIINSFQYALSKLGIDITDRNELKRFIGPPLKSSFGTFPGFDDDTINRAIEIYREYYKDKGIFENLVYVNIEVMLQELNNRKLNVYLATSKATLYSRQILEHFGLMKYFKAAEGSNYDGTRTKKEEVITYIIETYGLTNLDEIVMVGDRNYDIEGAHIVGIKAIAALWGYGSEQELKDAKADYFVKNAIDILNIV